MNKNDIYVDKVISYTHEGLGIIKIDKFPFFIPDVLVGEEIKFKVVKINKHFAYGKMIDIITPSCNRVYGLEKTSGANLMHMSYLEQLKFKREQVESLILKTFGKNSSLRVSDTIGMENPFNYRNKSIIPIAYNKGLIKMGYYRPRTHEVINIDNCHIQYEEHNYLLRKIRIIINKLNISVYDEITHKGSLRHIMFRTNSDKSQIMIGIIVKERFKELDEFIEEIKKIDKRIISIMLNINPDKTNVVLSNNSICLYGQNYITDSVDNIKFNISMNSFYQVNTKQMSVLYKTALDMAKLDKDDIVIDAYCGIGSISLFMAKNVKHIYGIEVVEQAIIDAKINAKINGIDNVTFLCGKSEDVILELIEKDITINTVIVDPPRKGCAEKFLINLSKMNIDKILYISCNPATLLRDINVLIKLGYKVENDIYPVDMFPFTHHVETVVLMSRG